MRSLVLDVHNIFFRKVSDIFQERFRDPASLVKDLHYSGFKAIWMLDPGIKQEEGYFVYDSGSKNDVWVQKADGTPYVGNVFLFDLNISVLSVCLFMILQNRPAVFFTSIMTVETFFSLCDALSHIYILRGGVAWTMCIP